MKISKKVIALILVLIAISILIFVYYIINKDNIIKVGKNEINRIVGEEKNIAKENVDNNIETINDNKEKNVVMDLRTELDYAIDVSDKKIRYDNSKYIIIGKVKSIDGATNYNEKKQAYTSIFTYGTIEINSILKGNIENREIPFIRLGGEISFEEYEKGLKDSQKVKMELVRTLSPEEKKTSFVAYGPEGDIQLEEGKTYLLYMDYDTDDDKYLVRYMQYGAWEVDTNTLNTEILNNKTQNKYNALKNNNQIKVKNNVTGKWENISDVL